MESLNKVKTGILEMMMLIIGIVIVSGALVSRNKVNYILMQTTGFVENGKSIYYYDPVTHEQQFGQKKIDGFWYMFDLETGEMVTGFYTHDENADLDNDVITTYYDEEGHMLYGQQFIDGYWYNFDKTTGAMKTGFVTIPEQNKICYYDENGHMLYGKQTIDGKEYVFKEWSGALDLEELFGVNK